MIQPAPKLDRSAVQRLLDAKGRGRQSPPPVLVPGVATLAEELRPVTGPTVILAVDVPPEATPTRAVPPGAVAQDL